MPQLNLAWWLFNFIIGWISLLIVLTILLNSQPQNSEPNTAVAPGSTNPNEWNWN
uniref:ATP synthase complex subunit 8 n=1 Tax=Pentaceraster mammillatus TaxID=2731074 RepID=A0A7S8HPU0_9ECHI|nr:ATP synthase F0 subunit 8 [Pentaceraster mammillatus]QPC56360.1 ATP synthase F0 subunit 8 [Pentaceraster mammillatus]WRK21211.1 ATP synthase F0 subunit 8 [Pentaceraster mammillatus]